MMNTDDVLDITATPPTPKPNEDVVWEAIRASLENDLQTNGGITQAVLGTETAIQDIDQAIDRAKAFRAAASATTTGTATGTGTTTGTGTATGTAAAPAAAPAQEHEKQPEPGNALLDVAMTNPAMLKCKNVLKAYGFLDIPGSDDGWDFPRSKRTVGGSESLSGGNVINEFDFIAHAFVGHYPYADRTSGRWAGESTPWERRLPFYARLHQMAHYDRLCPRRYRACAQVVAADGANAAEHRRALFRMTTEFGRMYAKWLLDDPSTDDKMVESYCAESDSSLNASVNWCKAAVQMLNEDGQQLVGILLTLLEINDDDERKRKWRTVMLLVYAVDHRSSSLRSVASELKAPGVAGNYGASSGWVERVHANIDTLGTKLQCFRCGLLWIAPGRMTATTTMALDDDDFDTLPRGDKVVLTLLRYEQGAQGTTPVDPSNGGLLLTTVHAHHSASKKPSSGSSQQMVDLLRAGSIEFPIDRPTVQFDTRPINEESGVGGTDDMLPKPVDPRYGQCLCMLCTGKNVHTLGTYARANNDQNYRLVHLLPMLARRNEAKPAFLRPTGLLGRPDTLYAIDIEDPKVKKDELKSRLTIGYRQASSDELNNLQAGFFPTHTVAGETFAIRKNTELIKTSRTRSLVKVPGQIGMCASAGDTSFTEASDSSLWFNNVLTFGVSLRAASYGGSTSLLRAYRNHAHDTKTTSLPSVKLTGVQPNPFG
jgi:hypothetical protein